ncbi:hypothetical protein K488DRAFT_90920 [Vararia minispora EC-137]|uniref:Uncharacterized protein n=1 Tax=Vararia minispora EC-137 TaxID=1314806 RepID=A0ACB8Q6H8_9AGAM|nr:hypothetical protein K488DRAFT_90920 [Vararia minispora EC-137]
MALLAANATPSPASARQIHSFLLSLDAVTRGIIIPTYVETVFWGAFTLLIMMSSYILLRWGLRTASSRVVFALTVLMYIMSTTIWAVDLVIAREELSLILPAQLTPPSAAAISAIRNVGSLVATPVILQTINIIVGDGIVLWRMCVVWSRNKIVVWISGVLVFLTAGFYIVFAIVQVVPESMRMLPASSTAIVGPIAFCLSFASNALATGMIAYKFWQNRTHIREELRSRSRRSAAEGGLILLIESGVLYVVLWAFYFATSFRAGMLGAFGAALELAMQQLTGLYPTLLVVIIAFQKSKIDRHARPRPPVIVTDLSEKWPGARAGRLSPRLVTPRPPPQSPVSVILIGNPSLHDTVQTTTLGTVAEAGHASV